MRQPSLGSYDWIYDTGKDDKKDKGKKEKEDKDKKEKVKK